MKTNYANVPWFARPNDLIGGWCVMPVDEPPSSGIPEVADFTTRELAEHIVSLHNNALACEFPVITICGSMRFYEIMLRAASELTGRGYIVIMPHVADYVGGKSADDKKRMLDIMHRRKIDMSASILVVTDETGYYGESTNNEIAYAASNAKTVEFYETDHIIPNEPESV